MIRDRKLARRQVERILAWDFERDCPRAAHGSMIERDGPDVVRRAYAALATRGGWQASGFPAGFGLGGALHNLALRRRSARDRFDATEKAIRPRRGCEK